MLNAPLIAFTFAHERNETNPPVRNLLKEQLQITSLVSPLVQQKHCETQALVNVGVDRLSELIDREGSRLIGLHYASDVATLLRAREGKEKSVERALRGKLGRKLGSLPHLKWVFLSGDGSQEQAESLLKAGVPLVIRSQNIINDDAAFRFAYFFYQALGQGVTLGEACMKATSEVRRDYVNKAKLTYEHEPPSGYGSDWPFAYHLNPLISSSMWWSVHHARGQAGVGLPRPEESSTPALPFTDFAPLTEEHSLCVVGKEAEARAVYDLVNAHHGPTVIVISGGDKVGKTSFLRARVSPLLSRDFHVRYAAFQQDALTTLSHALMSEEDLSLVRTWVELEGGRERVVLQPQMITELMNEAQSSFRSHYRADRADFSQFLRVIRAMWVRDELGDGENLLMRLGLLFDQQSKANQEESLTGEEIRPLAVMLDQFEETFLVNGSLERRRQERFWETIQQLCYDPNRPFRGRIILCVHERYTAQLTQLLNEKRLSHEHVYLPPLSREELVGYLTQLRESPKLREHFPLMIDERTPTAWSQLLDKTPPAELGYRFHAMMRHLWLNQSQRPLLISVDLLNQELGAESHLSDLLLERVRSFIALMHAQGDEDLNENFALDLLYRMAHVDDQPLEVEDFLTEYLKWNIELPEPWATRQRSLGDQSLWVITQAIDLGLFRGRLTAGTSLPSGSISLIHPILREVLEREWSTRLGAFSRAITRLVDYVQASLIPSTEDVQLARDAFMSMRLPTLDEAEVLTQGLTQLNERESRAKVSNRRDKLVMLTLSFVLLISMGRCTQLGGSVDELSLYQDHVSDQVRLLAADQAQRDGEPHNAAALLTEIRKPTLGSKWEELTIASLSTPQIVERMTSPHSWRRAELTPRALLVERFDQRKALWSGNPLALTHELGAPAHLDHNADGQHWVSFESGVLFFWSLASSQATRQRLAFSEIKSIHLNDEGTIAAVLNTEGVLSLHRSYNYPVKEFGGVRGARITRASISPDRKQLLMIDEREGFQTISLADERVGVSVESPPGTQLRQSAWIKSAPPSIVTVHAISRTNERRLTWHQRGREPLLIHQGAEEVRQLSSSPYLAQVALELDGAKAPQRILKVIDLTNPQRASSLVTPPLLPISDLGFDPTGARLVIASARGESRSLKLFSLRERSPAIELPVSQHLPTLVSISHDGASVLGMGAEGVTRWNAYDGRFISSYRYAKLSPIAMSDADSQLRVALSDPSQHRGSALLKWSLNDSLLGLPMSTSEEEISEAAWHEDDLIMGNQRGELMIWSGHQQVTPKVKFNGHQDRVSVIAIDLAQQSFVSGAEDGSIARWSLSDGRALARFDGHKAPVSSIATSAQEGGLASGDRRGMIKYWRSGSPQAQSWRGHKTRVQSLSFSPNGELLVSTSASSGPRDAGGVIWRLNEGPPQQVAMLPQDLIEATWAKRDGSVELLGVTQRGGLISWSESSGAPKTLGSLREELNGSKLIRADFSDQGSWLIGITDQGSGVLYQLSRARVTPINLPQGRLTVARFLRSKLISQRPNALPALTLGDSLGQLWIWRAGQLMKLGDHQGPLSLIRVSERDGSIFSASETHSLRWRGPFNLESLSERLQKMARLCLSPRERIKLLAESTQEAEAQHQRCLKRQ